MKNLKMSIAVMLLLTISFANAQENGKMKMDHSKMDHSKMTHSKSDAKAEAILKGYFNLKDALVADNTQKAAQEGTKLTASLKAFDASKYTAEEQKELADIIEDATEHAEHIGKSEMDHQREHFKTLSKDISDLVAITGTKNTLYEQFCPFYDGGSAWLSMQKEIKNPYLGSKMATCGKVQKDIN